MALWNDLNLALHNAFATASLLSNVHPDEAVRTRGEQAEQDAHRLLTEIGLDRDLYDVLAAVDPPSLDEGGRRVHALALRDFRRAGVDQDERRSAPGCASSPSGRPRSARSSPRTSATASARSRSTRPPSTGCPPTSSRATRPARTGWS